MPLNHSVLENVDNIIHTSSNISKSNDNDISSQDIEVQSLGDLTPKIKEQHIVEEKYIENSAPKIEIVENLFGESVMQFATNSNPSNTENNINQVSLQSESMLSGNIQDSTNYSNIPTSSKQESTNYVLPVNNIPSMPGLGNIVNNGVDSISNASIDIIQDSANQANDLYSYINQKNTETKAKLYGDVNDSPSVIVENNTKTVDISTNASIPDIIAVEDVKVVTGFAQNISDTHDLHWGFPGIQSDTLATSENIDQNTNLSIENESRTVQNSAANQSESISQVEKVVDSEQYVRGSFSYSPSSLPSDVTESIDAVTNSDTTTNNYYNVNIESQPQQESFLLKILSMSSKLLYFTLLSAIIFFCAAVVYWYYGTQRSNNNNNSTNIVVVNTATTTSSGAAILATADTGTSTAGVSNPHNISGVDDGGAVAKINPLLFQVSSSTKLPITYAPDNLVAFTEFGGGKLDALTLDNLKLLAQDVEAQGFKLKILNSYKSSYELGTEAGLSELQLGNTVTVICGDCKATTDAGNTKLYEYLKNNAHRFGFLYNSNNVAGNIRYYSRSNLKNIFNL